jgi:hypothetical protein
MTHPGAWLPDPRMIPRWTAPASRPPAAQDATTLTDPPAGVSVDKTLVRPCFVTAARTQPLHDGLRIHTGAVGVARVLIADLVNGGYMKCHDQNQEDLAVDVIERIRDRVRAL